MKTILLSLSLAILSILKGCTGGEDECSSGNLQFDLPVQADGIADTLYIGDTLRIKLEIPDKLTERNSGESYVFKDYNFKLITYMVKIDSFPATARSIETFEWITVSGQSQYESGVFLVWPDYFDNIYHYEVKIIPRKKGLYVFGMNSDFNRISPLEKLSGPCSKNEVEVYMKLGTESNTNFKFLQQSPDPAQSNTDQKRFDEYAGFCFYVR